MSERIIVIRREDLFASQPFHGVRRDATAFLQRLDQHSFSALRSEAETRRDWKQPIPYVLLTQGDQVFVTRRTDQGLEERLHHQVSLGIGGHMRESTETTSFSQLVQINALRELREELYFEPGMPWDGLPLPLEPLGVLNDDTNDVGQCHFGLIFRLEVPGTIEVGIRETDLLTGSFVNRGAIPLPEQMETWSRYCLPLLEGLQTDAE